MKKIYLFTGIMLLGATLANSQGISRKPNDSRKGNKMVMEGSVKLEEAPELNAVGCDTLLYNPNNATLYGVANYTWGTGNGYVSGTNKYGDKQIGNLFDVSGSANSNYVTGVRFVMAKVASPDLTKKVYFRVYNLGSGGITLAGSSPAFALSDLQPFVGGYTDYKFPTAISIPDKAFIISLDISELSWAANDSVSLFSNNINAVNVPDSAVFQASDNSWDYFSGYVGDSMFVYLFPYVSDNQSCTLPVTLSGLSALKTGNANKLTWSTLNESSNKGFEVQRSSDGQHFSKLGFVQSAGAFGNSSKPLHYEFIDNSPLEKANYYRIKQIDFDGKSKFSNITLVHRSLEKEKGIVLNYPNPTRGSINLQLAASKQGNQTITVTNVNGTVVLQQPIIATGSIQNFTLNVSNLPKGTYIVRLIGEEKAAKFVKE